jgi:hypothetical protein
VSSKVNIWAYIFWLIKLLVVSRNTTLKIVPIRAMSRSL